MTTNLTRRDFVKTAAGAAALAGIDIPFVRPGGSDVIKIGMIGSGGRCSGAAEQAMGTGPDVRLTAMCDVFEDRVKDKLAVLKKTKPDQVEVNDDRQFVGFDGYRKVIDCCDVVLIACASKFHPRYAKAAIEAGRHVFVEKPHGIDPAGCREMDAACELAKEKKLSLMSGLQWRHDPGVQETLEKIHAGAIGDIVSIEVNFLRAPYQVVRRKPGMSETMYQFYNWYHFCWLSGDDVIQSLVHNIDCATWALKGVNPTQCHGLAGRSASFGEQYGDMFDHHAVVYDYPGGVKMYALCRTQKKCHSMYSTLLRGTKGACSVFERRIEGETPWRYPEKPQDSYQAEQNTFFAAIRRGEPVNSGDYMVKSTRIAVMGQIACYTGQMTKWVDLEPSDFAFEPRDGNFDTEPPVKPGPDGNYPLPKPGITKLKL